MITAKRDDHYKNIRNASRNMVLYALTENDVTNPRNVLENLTGSVYSENLDPSIFTGSVAYISLDTNEIVMRNKQTKKELIVSLPAFSVLIAGPQISEKWDYTILNNTLTFYEESILSLVYLKTEIREMYGNVVSEKIQFLKNLPPWKQCIQKYKELYFLGKGSYANVFAERNTRFPCAIKISRIKPEYSGTEFSTTSSAWHEIFILKDIIRPMIINKMCPNLPLLYDYATCDHCKILTDGKKTEQPCITLFTELASGTLKNYLQKDRSSVEIYSALFQIMAGLACIQLYSQIMNYDIKKENILYYDVHPGGFWKYTIQNKDYYIPNTGKLFILNDFGISRSMSMKYVMKRSSEEKNFRLGHRYGIIKNGKIKPISTSENTFCETNPSDSPQSRQSNRSTPNAVKVKWLPRKSTFGVEYKLEDGGNIIPDVSVSRDFFNDPNVFPPFEFYNDTQDAIRMFTGGKRTTQNGQHRKLDTVPNKIISQMLPYVGKGNSAKDNIFSLDPAQLMANYFITSFFPEYTNFCEPQENVIESYKF